VKVININSRSALQSVVEIKCTLVTGNGGDTAGDNRVQPK